jgi:hypothetical protein
MLRFSRAFFAARDAVVGSVRHELDLVSGVPPPARKYGNAPAGDSNPAFDHNDGISSLPVAVGQGPF